MSTSATQDEPTVRLVAGANALSRGETAFGTPAPPTVRLACANGPGCRGDTFDAPPTVRLAHGGPPDAVAMGLAPQTDPAELPALLVSYMYLEPFQQQRPRYHFRDWVMDSGAFTAHASGKPIDVKAYIDCCLHLLATDPQLTEVFALDVIGDWRASVKNAEVMWKAGVPAIPCYHVGEPEFVLEALCKLYPKVALGGAVGYRGKDEWAQQCFARVWPKRLHGFGFGSEKSIMMLPWHSVDATNWEIGPCKFGNWPSLGGKVSVRGGQQNLRGEVKRYLDIEKKARAKWAGAMAQLPPLTPPSPTPPPASTP